MRFILLLLCSLPQLSLAQDLSAFSSQSFTGLNASFEHQDGQIEEQKFTFGVPLYRGGESALALTARGQRVDLGDKLVFPISKTDVPDEFGSADFGLYWNNEDSAGNKVGLSASYGEAGTRLFGGGNAAVVSATGFIERKKEDHAWIYSLNYSNNRALLNGIPVPGIAYALNRPTYNAILGLPFAFVNWRPDPWMVTAAASPFGASFEPAYRFWGPLMSFAHLNWSPRSYANVIKGREDRLLYDKKEAGAGLRMMLGRKGSLSLGYVFAFGRRLMIGKSLWDRGNETVSVEDTSGLQAKVKYIF